MSRAGLGLVLLVLTPAGWWPEQAPTIADSYQQARRLLDHAIDAHGGGAALQRARRVHIEFSGQDVWRHQSRRPAPPYDRRPAAGELRVDLDAGRLIYDLARSYPGNIHRHFQFATGDRDHYLNHRQRTYTLDDYPPADQQLNNIYYVPQLVLALADESGTRLRSLGTLRLANGSTVDAITTTVANGAMTIGLDPATQRLHSVMVIRNDAVGGQVAAEIEFLDYREVDGALTPGRRRVSIDGEVTEDFAFDRVTYGAAVPDALVTPPAGYELREPVEPPAVRALADNVWLVGSGSASLVVALGEQLVVIDASPATANAVVSQMAKLLPGRKVTHVVPTHHHDDHAPGIRAFAREGAAVLTTPGNKGLFESITGQPVQIIDRGRHVFTAGDRSVEIHAIGSSPHADEMLVAWLPKEGILFEADLLDVASPGIVEAGANNDTTMHFAGWLRDRAWKVAQYAGAHGGLIDPAAFERLVAQPVRTER